jgi:hypothetical protein
MKPPALITASPVPGQRDKLVVAEKEVCRTRGLDVHDEALKTITGVRLQTEKPKFKCVPSQSNNPGLNSTIPPDTLSSN